MLLNFFWSSYVCSYALEVCVHVLNIIQLLPKITKKINFKGLYIYGILTDLRFFSFYSYDPKSNTFCKDDEISVRYL
jgi:hypothetical protein